MIKLVQIILFIIFSITLLSCSTIDPDSIRLSYPGELDFVSGYFSRRDYQAGNWGVRQFQISGDYIFLATSENPTAHLDILEIDSDQRFKQVATFDLGRREIDDLFLSNEHVFIASGTRLDIYNVADPSSPYHIGYVAQHSDLASSVLVSGDYAYFYTVQSYDGVNALGEEIFHPDDLPRWLDRGPNWTVLDISDKESIQAIQEIADLARPIAISGNYIYAAELWHQEFDNVDVKFQIIDISDKANPTLISELQVENSIHDIEVVGDIAYLGAGSGLRLIDVSDPAYPRIIQDSLSFYGIGSFANIALENNMVAGDFGWLGRFNFSGQSVEFEPVAKINEDRLNNLLCSKEGLTYFTSNEQQRNFCSPLGYGPINEIKMRDGYIYIATEANGLLVFKNP